MPIDDRLWVTYRGMLTPDRWRLEQHGRHWRFVSRDGQYESQHFESETEAQTATFFWICRVRSRCAVCGA